MVIIYILFTIIKNQVLFDCHHKLWLIYLSDILPFLLQNILTYFQMVWRCVKVHIFTKYIFHWPLVLNHNRPAFRSKKLLSRSLLILIFLIQYDRSLLVNIFHLFCGFFIIFVFSSHFFSVTVAMCAIIKITPKTKYTQFEWKMNGYVLK